MTDIITAGGYNGKILRVNLSTRSVTAETISELFCRRYIGGAGFVAYFLWKELQTGIDALAPDNKLVFALGPVSGLLLPGASRVCVGGKSPLTGGIAKSEVGGFWPAEFKRAGYDAIIVEGKAATPVYLWVHDGEASIRSAGHLWGKRTKETEAEIRTELGDDRIQTVQIGRAGENRVRYACIMSGLHDAAGRGGLGAVMGSKNLKAIAVRGHNLPRIANSERLREIRQQTLAKPSRWSEFGTGSPEMPMMESSGNLPVRNFRDGLFPEVKQIHGGVIRDTIRIGMDGCFACHVRCKKVVQCEEPYHVDGAYGGPEYETLAGFGSNCGIGNLKAIAKGNELCGAYSLDTISTSGAIAFAMECFEKGLLSTSDTDGIELRFGNAEAMLKTIERIAQREGIGNLLAEGTARAAKKIGNGSEKFAMQVKGLEAGYHEPRLRPTLGLGYMVNPHGADHCASMGALSPEELRPLGILGPPGDPYGPRAVSSFRLGQFKSILQDSLLVCQFVPYSYQMQTELMAAATGWDSGVNELLTVAERTLMVARLFNIREGLSAADDVLPDRYFQPKTDGALADKPLDRTRLEKARSFYYTLMGWDAKGVPLPEKLEELCIE